MTVIDHFQRNIVTYTLAGIVVGCLTLGIIKQPSGTKRTVNNVLSEDQPTLYEKVLSTADRQGNNNGRLDLPEVVDIWQRAGYSLSFNPEHRLVAQRGTETIVFGNEFKDPQLSNADLEKVLASYK